MQEHFADRLLAAIRQKNAPACVGLDPRIEHFPPDLRREFQISADSPGRNGTSSTLDPVAAAEAIGAFGRAVIDAIAPHVPAIKINIAFFEPYDAAGIRIYRKLIQEAHASGLIVIGDIKRADIGHSTTQYARAHLGGPDAAPSDLEAMADAVTVNPYFGIDGVRPFIEAASKTGRGLFVLVQTSNESAAEVQGLKLADGATVVQRVAEQVEGWAVDDTLIGGSGYSCVGAVVSPRDLESTKCIRTLMPHCLFLVPGFGAQGRTAQEVATCFKPDGTGALVTASRSVIYAYETERDGARNWQACISQACRQYVSQIQHVLSL